jgi:hypothetical protein
MMMLPALRADVDDFFPGLETSALIEGPGWAIWPVIRGDLGIGLGIP